MRHPALGIELDDQDARLPPRCHRRRVQPACAANDNGDGCGSAAVAHMRRPCISAQNTSHSTSTPTKWANACNRLHSSSQAGGDSEGPQ
ncbi:MAG: hypothetical protein JNK06_01795 [Candidatus Accumulibacter phosphatis]|uniref:hypothetical protein n=1 Tax=Candidatus Accumulibacter phosphatis TaxID=327160 RepID=UPI001A42BE2C|nr:hypothetical protein [Candidatus Accumulibacter phosphatis]